MNKKSDVLAIIPARSGSKRLPNKNIMHLHNKPLLAWSIESALNSKYIDEVVVSTDSKLYADIAKSYGANVPFLRPKELSKDTTPTFDVIEHSINFYKNNLNKFFKYIIVLQPTSPIRKVEHINEAYNKLISSNVYSVISVCKCEHPPLWSNTLPDNDNMSNFLAPSIKNIRSQDLPTFYRLNGSISIADTKELLKYKSFFTPKTLAYRMPRIYSSDIDTDIDFKIADIIMDSLVYKDRGGVSKYIISSPQHNNYLLVA